MNKRGFTLIELILFIVIFTLGVMGIMVLYFNVLGKTSNPIIRERGIQVAQAVMDEILSKKWDENTPNGGCKDSDYTTVCSPNNSSIGPDPGENSINDYDDVDDYVDSGSKYKKSKTWKSEDFGLTPGFSVKITVSYADVDSSGKITENTTTKTFYKLITVEVSSNLIHEKYKIIAVKADF